MTIPYDDHHDARRWMLGLVKDRSVDVMIRRKILLAGKEITDRLSVHFERCAAAGADDGPSIRPVAEVPGEYLDLMTAAVARDVGAVCGWAATWEPSEEIIIRHGESSTVGCDKATVGAAGAGVESVPAIGHGD